MHDVKLTYVAQNRHFVPGFLADYVRAAMHASSVVAVATFAISSSVMDPALFATCVSILPHAIQSKRITIIICILTLPFAIHYISLYNEINQVSLAQRFLRNDTRYQFASVQKSGSGNMLRVLRTSEKYDYYDFQKRAKTTTTAARFFITGPRTCPIPQD